MIYINFLFRNAIDFRVFPSFRSSHHHLVLGLHQNIRSFIQGTFETIIWSWIHLLILIPYIVHSGISFVKVLKCLFNFVIIWVMNLETVSTSVLSLAGVYTTERSRSCSGILPPTAGWLVYSFLFNDISAPLFARILRSSKKCSRLIWFSNTSSATLQFRTTLWLQGYKCVEKIHRHSHEFVGNGCLRQTSNTFPPTALWGTNSKNEWGVVQLQLHKRVLS